MTAGANRCPTNTRSLREHRIRLFTHDRWKFVPAQLADIRDPKLVTPESRPAAIDKSSRKSAGQHIAPTAKIPLCDIVVLIQVVDPGLCLPDDL